jgi:2-dehydro-3-deoxygluconokinase
MPDLVTLGETCVVLVAKTAGPLRYSAEFERRLGGAESTVAVGVSRLGYSTGWMSRLGNDEFGAYIIGQMRGENVNVDHVHLSDNAQTGVFFRENRVNGRSSVYYYRKDSAFANFSPEDLDEDYIASARILHLTGITPGLSVSCRAAVERAIDIAKANKVPVVFDPNYRSKIWKSSEAQECLENLMTRADHVLAGQEDLVKLTGLSNEKECMGYLHDLGITSVILKLGRNGALLSTEDGVERISGYLMENPVDRFGVGDSFAAGFIVGLLDGRSLKDSITLGNAVAGWSIQLPGNIEALPDWNDLKELQNGKGFVAR